MSDLIEQAKTFFLQGLAHYQAGRFTQADTDFSASLSLVPGRASTLTNLGVVRLKLGKFEQAVDLLQEALAQEPDNTEALGHCATALAELGQHGRALSCVERLLALGPGLGQAWSLRGNLLKDMGRIDEAAAAFEQAIAHGADNELNRYNLAALTGRQVPSTAPRPYVETLFDGYAGGFEEHLVQVLKYRVPAQLVEGSQRFRSRFDSALDLGCGTGLCGPLLRPLTQQLVGVDLSGNMVERARQQGVYDQVVQADLVDFLAACQRSYGLVIAADVFVYLGALEPVFSGVARVIDPGGLFTFSVESAEAGQGDFALRPSLRYAHSAQYIERLSGQFGFRILATREHAIREDQGRPIDGLLCWLVKQDGPPGA